MTTAASPLRYLLLIDLLLLAGYPAPVAREGFFMSYPQKEARYALESRMGVYTILMCVLV